MFDEERDVDMAAWKLVNTADFQRLRRVKQLGVSDYVYPSATHSRFAHSIGVFHNARRLVGLIEREIAAGRAEGKFEKDRADTALFAALLHDIGHGPFSHAFERARRAIAEANTEDGSEPKIVKHEDFTADMVLDAGGDIPRILAEIGVKAADVAGLIRAETPKDMYHAVVSSSFDADRLDYFQRDRYMTGVGAGAIDLEWLMDNVRVAEIDVSPDEGGDAVYRHSFCLCHKARDAAEDFLLARYRLFTHVYLHKATRGIEQLITALFLGLAQQVTAGYRIDGLEEDHPLVTFFSRGGDTLVAYRDLDDVVVWGAMHSLARSGVGRLQELSERILNRHKPGILDLQVRFPSDNERQRKLQRRLSETFGNGFGDRVFRDSEKLTLYGAIGADDSRAHKRLMIQLANGELREITDFGDATISRSDIERRFDRYYFLDEADLSKAEGIANEVAGRVP